MSFARDGFTYITIAALVAAAMYAIALNRRSWALWLIAFALTIVALWVAYFFRDPRLPAPRDRVASLEEGVTMDDLNFMRPIRTTPQPSVFLLSSAARRPIREPMLDGSVSLTELRTR